jgi:hypothetical protein
VTGGRGDTLYPPPLDRPAYAHHDNGAGPRGGARGYARRLTHVKGGLHASSHAGYARLRIRPHGYGPGGWRHRRNPELHTHIYDLARAHAQSGIDAHLLPLSVDGLIIAASLALATAPVLARCVLALGVAATVAANVGYGLPHGCLAAIVSAWPGISFVGAAELLPRSRRQAPAEIPAAVPAAVPMPELPGTAELPDTSAGIPELETIPATDTTPVPAGSDAARVFAAEVAAGKVPGIREIRRRMRCGQPAAYTVQAQLRELAAA